MKCQIQRTPNAEFLKVISEATTVVKHSWTDALSCASLGTPAVGAVVPSLLQD